MDRSRIGRWGTWGRVPPGDLTGLRGGKSIALWDSKICESVEDRVIIFRKCSAHHPRSLNPDFPHWQTGSRRRYRYNRKSIRNNVAKHSQKDDTASTDEHSPSIQPLSTCAGLLLFIAISRSMRGKFDVAASENSQSSNRSSYR